MIYLPLILVGVDKIYKKQKPWLYMGMLAVATVSSFYFTYMICIFVAIYALLRYLMLFGNRFKARYDTGYGLFVHTHW